MRFEQFKQTVYSQDLMDRRCGESADLAEELLRLASGLVGIEHPPACVAGGHPAVRHLAWQEDGVTGVRSHQLTANLEIELTLDDVHPLVLSGSTSERRITAPVSRLLGAKDLERTVAFWRDWIKRSVFEVRDPDGHVIWFGQSYHQKSPERPRHMMSRIMPELPSDDVPAAVTHYRDVIGSASTMPRTTSA